jgi:NAD(P)-dependent dehydrogenase (short-subunit alcohol dehydrogenase family)
MSRLDGTPALVVGAAGGIGAAIAERLIKDGAVVGGVDIDAERIGETSCRLGLAFGSAIDPADSEALPALAGEVERKLGGLEIVVNAQGISDAQDTRLVTLTDDVYARTMRANLDSVVKVCRMVIPLLLARQAGVIINFSSIGATRGTGGTAYVMTKAAIEGLTLALSHQLAPKNVRCIAIAPGPIETPMLEGTRAKFGGRIPEPLGRGCIAGTAQPSEVAALVAFLVSDEARYISGAVYRIDGGRSR